MTENTKKRRLYIFSLLPTVVATLLTSAYILNFWPWLELPLVNVLCAPLIMLTFVHGLTEEVNKYKAFAFTTSVVIAGIETFLNFSTDKITLEVFRLELLSPWSFGWAGMLLISIGAFLAVLIRLLLWSQDKWMEVKEMRQAQRMEQRQLHIENRRQRQSEAQKARQERLEQERQHSKEVLQRRQAAEKETREQEYARQKEAYQHKFEKQDERFKRWKEFVERQRTARANGTQPEDSSTWKITKNVFRWFLYIAIISILAFLFWKVPYYSLSNTVAEDSPWIDHVVVFVELLQHQESKDTEELTATSVFENQKDDESGDVENRVEQLSRPNPVQALIYYLVIFSVAIGVILMLLIIIWSLVGRIFKCKKSMIDFSFATDYDLPISILLVFLAILLVLGGNGLNLGVYQVSQWWEVLCLIVIVVIIVFITIEVLLIVIKQCSEKASLLKELILLAFIVLLEFVGNLFISIIVNFRIHSLISSLAAMIFMPDEEDTFANDVVQKLQDMFRRAVRGELEDNHSVFDKANTRRQIWRR